MKKLISAVVILAVLLSLAACGEISITQKIQFEKTGMSIPLPKSAKDTVYSVIESDMGEKFPKTEFVYGEIAFSATADKSGEHDISGYTNVIFDGYDYYYAVIDGEMFAFFTRDGVNYLYMAESKNEAIVKLLIADVHAVLSPDGVLNPDAEPRAEFAVGTWKADDSEDYIRLRGNYTYAQYGETKTGKRIVFWSYQGKDIVVLKNGKDETASTMRLSREGDCFILTSDRGIVYRSFDTAMDGYYSCELDLSCKSGDMLNIVERLDSWVSDNKAKALKVGDILPTSVGCEPIEVESIRETGAKRIMFNEQMQLVYDDTAKAWKMVGSGISIKESAGFGTVTENTLISDRRCDVNHENIFGCIKDSQKIYATISIWSGKISRTVIDSVFMG